MLSDLFVQPHIVVYLPEQGMETDRMIAKDVFGWSDDKSERNSFYDPWASLWRPKPEGTPATPAWSRNPSDTLKVIEQMELMGFEGEICREGGSYHVSFTAHGGHGAADYPDFSYAVCLAALGALRVIC